MDWLHIIDQVATVFLACVLTFTLVTAVIDWGTTKRWEKREAKARARFWERLDTDEATVTLNKKTGNK